jgi:hypothetical protein
VFELLRSLLQYSQLECEGGRLSPRNLDVRAFFFFRNLAESLRNIRATKMGLSKCRSG